MLLELNSDVKGDFIDEESDQILENDPEYFTKFSVVVATALTEKYVGNKIPQVLINYKCNFF